MQENVNWMHLTQNTAVTNMNIYERRGNIMKEGALLE
jgi:hypothetical protein